MPWARFDERYPSHRKVRPLSDAAFRLDVSAVCWSSEHLTDGRVAEDELVLVSDVKRPRVAAAELVRRGRWEVIDGGWLIHDFHVYNPTSDKVRADREAAADRQRRAREASRSRRQSQPESRRDSAVSHSERAVPPTRPDPTRPVLGVPLGEEVEVELGEPHVHFQEQNADEVRRTLRAVVATWPEVDPDELERLA